MPVNGINNSEAARVEPVRVEQPAEDTRIEERRHRDEERGEAQVDYRAAETEQGGNIDITV
ncbi:MAG: hypothetical protein JXA18_09040 [Chitinispirillaceae bacterium]|nr:hypothetical protein [Chitinispirillaceae bacterium]